MGHPDEPLILLSRITFDYGSGPVLEGVGIGVAAGEIYGLLGADGAGKSTLLRIAVGQLQPQAGEARVLGRPVTAPGLAPGLAYMPQGFGLYPDLSVEENLAFFADLHGLAADVAATRIRDLLQRTGMQRFGRRRAGRLSGGMMQKLALACALVSEPRAMFLDEPTTGVDPVSRRAFWQLLNGVRAEGVAILYATANLDEAERCDRVGLLEGGRIRRQGTPDQLARVEGRRLFTVTGPGVRQALAALRRLPGVEWVFPRGRAAVLWLRDGSGTEAVRHRLQRIAPALRLRETVPGLQETVLWELAQRSRDGS